MFCSNCGTKLHDHSNFCHACGGRLSCNKILTESQTQSKNIAHQQIKGPSHVLNIFPILMTIFILLGAFLPVITFSDGDQYCNFFQLYGEIDFYLKHDSNASKMFTFGVIILICEFLSGSLLLYDLFHQEYNKTNITCSMMCSEIYAICLWILCNMLNITLSWVGWSLIILPIFNMFTCSYIRSINKCPK